MDIDQVPSARNSPAEQTTNCTDDNRDQGSDDRRGKVGNSAVDFAIEDMDHADVHLASTCCLTGTEALTRNVCVPAIGHPF